MIDLHYWPTPNGWKITIMLEECGLPYTVVPVDITRRGQHEPAFLAISPNHRIPAIVDRSPADGGEPVAIFESGAILQYLAEKSGRFLPAAPRQKYAALQWLYWQVGGLGPMAGQNGHFLLYAEEKIPYAIERYGAEMRRLYQVMDRQLQRTGAHLAGDYSVADMAAFPWVMTHKAQGFTLDEWPGLKRWFAAVRARPQVQAGLAVGREWRRPAGTAMDEETRRSLFAGAAASRAAKE